MGLYGRYIKERLGKDIIEKEWGFATYELLEDGAYIENIFVDREYRREGNAALLADQIAVIARQRNLKYLYGSVAPSALGSSESLKVLLAYGFELYSSVNNFILFRKEI